MTAIKLRNFHTDDLRFLTDLRNDIATQHLLMAHPKTSSSPEEVREWVSRRENEAHGLFRIISKPQGPAVGFVQVHNVHRLDRVGPLGIALAMSERGCGLVRAELDLAIERCQSELNLRKIMLFVRADNLPALRLYARQDFEKIGVLRRHYCETPERVHDVVLMERLLEGPQA